MHLDADEIPEPPGRHEPLLLRLAAVFAAGEGQQDNPTGLGYRERGRRALEAFRSQWSRAPQALPQMLCALELALESPRHVVLAGDPHAADFQALAAVVAEQLGPHRAVLAADGGEGQEWLAARACKLPRMDELRQELVAPTYTFTSNGRIKVEGKQEMKRRGMRSPDLADSLCITFASIASRVGGRSPRWVPGKPMKRNIMGVV